MRQEIEKERPTGVEREGGHKKEQKLTEVGEEEKLCCIPDL